MDYLEQEINNEVMNGEHKKTKCDQCGKEAELKHYVVRCNYADKVIWCCSEQCAGHYQMGCEG